VKGKGKNGGGKESGGKVLPLGPRKTIARTREGREKSGKVGGRRPGAGRPPGIHTPITHGFYAKPKDPASLDLSDMLGLLRGVAERLAGCADDMDIRTLGDVASRLASSAARVAETKGGLDAATKGEGQSVRIRFEMPATPEDDAPKPPTEAADAPEG